MRSAGIWRWQRLFGQQFRHLPPCSAAMHSEAAQPPSPDGDCKLRVCVTTEGCSLAHQVTRVQAARAISALPLGRVADDFEKEFGRVLLGFADTSVREVGASSHDLELMSKHPGVKAGPTLRDSPRCGLDRNDPQKRAAAFRSKRGIRHGAELP